MADDTKPRHVVAINGRSCGRSLLLARAVHGITGQGGEPPRSLLDELRTRGAPLSGLKVVGVPSGHEHYPEPKQFKLEGRTLYVRAEDFPKLQEALERQRALRRGPSEPIDGSTT